MPTDLLERQPLDSGQLHGIDAWWRAANYLSVGQIYLRANPLLREPLVLAHVKRMLLGHWGTTPGQNFIYAHLNRVIRQHELDMLYISGPGHGGPAVVANAYLDGTSGCSSSSRFRVGFPVTPRRNAPARCMKAVSLGTR